MKFLSWLGLILFVLVIIATFTAPGDQKFTDFISKDKSGDTMSCKPIIGKSTEVKLLVKLASIKYVSYCESRLPFVLPDKTGEKRELKFMVPKVTHSEMYLGLF